MSSAERYEVLKLRSRPWPWLSIRWYQEPARPRTVLYGYTRTMRVDSSMLPVFCVVRVRGRVTAVRAFCTSKPLTSKNDELYFSELGHGTGGDVCFGNVSQSELNRDPVAAYWNSAFNQYCATWTDDAGELHLLVLPQREVRQTGYTPRRIRRRERFTYGGEVMITVIATMTVCLASAAIVVIVASYVASWLGISAR